MPGVSIGWNIPPSIYPPLILNTWKSEDTRCSITPYLIPLSQRPPPPTPVPDKELGWQQPVTLADPPVSKPLTAGIQA